MPTNWQMWIITISCEEQTKRELLAQIIKRKMALFGHACRNNRCNLVKTCILEMMHGKRRKGRPRMQHIDNIKKWTRASLEGNIRVTEDTLTSELPTPTKASKASNVDVDIIYFLRTCHVIHQRSHSCYIIQ